MDGGPFSKKQNPLQFCLCWGDRVSALLSSSATYLLDRSIDSDLCIGSIALSDLAALIVFTNAGERNEIQQEGLEQ